LLQLIKTKTFRIAAIMAVLLGLYALAGFVLVPKLLRAELMKEIPPTLGVTPTVGEIHFNPFTFRLEVKDFSLSVPGGDVARVPAGCWSTSALVDLAPRIYLSEHRHRGADNHRHRGARWRAQSIVAH
jgi:hypothetical protein